MKRIGIFLLAGVLGLLTTFTTPDADACGGAQRRQARRQARFEPAEQVQFSYQVVPVQTYQLVPVESVQKVEVKAAQTAVKCTNPDCKCGENCTCAESALRSARAGAVEPPLAASVFRGGGYETVCENGVCFRRALLPRWRR